jgi:hypothetical protein
MSGTNHANPVYDAVGSALAGSTLSTEVILLAATSTAGTGTLVAGETYKLYGNQDFCFVVYPASGGAVAATSNHEEVGAKIPEWYTPEVDSKIAVITPTDGDTGYVKVTRKKRVS